MAERDRAYQSRDRAFSLLSAAALLHQIDERTDKHCVCGSAWSTCEVGRLLEDEGRGLRNWESKQRERLLAGHGHWLPDNHPFVLDRRTVRG